MQIAILQRLSCLRPDGRAGIEKDIKRQEAKTIGEEKTQGYDLGRLRHK